ncbi:MAG: methionine--tRNA ligase subunit beta [Minisyncoccota bacterium]
MINIDDIKKVEIRAGKIISAEPIEGSEKLLKLTVDFGLKSQSGSLDHSSEQNGLGEERDIRTILSGIAKYFPQGEGLVGIICGFVANLEPRPMMGLESQGMILAVSGENYFSLLKFSDDVPPGALVK